jgi:hypothetical protein
MNDKSTKWGSPVEVETRNRIMVAIAAYAYEVADDPIMSDPDYDELAKKIDVSVDTGNKELDAFFREHYADYTGQWVWKHPGADRLKQLYEMKREYIRNKK